MGLKSSFWSGKKVLITGHTGFKGAWLSILLHYFGANVVGIGLDNNNHEKLIPRREQSNIYSGSYIEDIRNRENLGKIINREEPDIVFHLAAQPLVIESYLNPVETWETNLMGTINARSL